MVFSSLAASCRCCAKNPLIPAVQFSGTTSPHPYDGATGEAATVAALLGGLAPVMAEFTSLSGALRQARPDICLSDELRDAHGYLGPEENRIVLDATLDRATMQAILLHELRHLDQLSRGACPDQAVSMQASAAGVMAMEADASAVAMLAAWYLRSRGDARVWQALRAWPTQSDIADAFAQEMSLSGDPARAAAAAFDQWYASDWRRDSYYVAACMDYLDVQEKSKRRPQYNALPGDFLQRLCRMPGGGTYRCAPPEGDAQ